jgi:hypothetical protein
MMKQLLIIGHNFPEPFTTAAGGRIIHLIELFLEQGFTITFASTALKSERSADLQSIRIKEVSIKLNDPSFDEFLKDLQPNVVMFDRFITEEQFGWRVAEVCPKSLKILDTEDLHFLRKAREEAYKKGIPVTEANLYTDTAKRELASILRCDLNLIISEIEIKLLITTFQIPEGLVWYLPFLISSEISDAQKIKQSNFEERQHFMAVGNMKHAPNVASVSILKEHIWPTLQQRFPQAELHIYGAYVPQQLQEMHSSKDRFFIKGWIQDISAVMQKARVQLAPLPFGAGLKGKILDAFQNGLPTATTSIGTEGMVDIKSQYANVTNNWKDFCLMATNLYTDRIAWNASQKEGYGAVLSRFQKNSFAIPFSERVSFLLENLETHRQQHFIGQIIQYKTVQATKYMSKWIEEKGA